jgi:hypothetical protein
MDEQLPGHTEFLVQYETAAGLMGRGRGGGLGGLVSYENADLGRANGFVNMPWQASGLRAGFVRGEGGREPAGCSRHRLLLVWRREARCFESVPSPDDGCCRTPPPLLLSDRQAHPLTLLTPPRIPTLARS